MVARAEAIMVLRPLARPLVDFEVRNGVISKWNVAVLGSQPTEAELDAITQAQVDSARQAKYRADAVSKCNTTEELGKIIRALCGLIANEFNILREQVIGIETLTYDPASMANGTGVTSPNITVAGAQFRDVVDVVAPYSLQGIIATAYVSAANTVNFRLHNGTGAAVNLASGLWAVCVRRPQVMAPRDMNQAKNSLIAVLNSMVAD